MKLTNTYEILHDDWFSWTVFIQGDENELNNIKQVTYILHESFPQRRIISTNPSNKFARSMKGWGEFLLKGEAELKDGRKMVAELWLDLGMSVTMANKSQHNGEFFFADQVGLGETLPET